ncbi:hypothetical protein CBS101457_000057 [Exobasidium rhododendri]|nr:hypothetical protein CBS101457_000057 [Exobasidium rhododendri]
MLAALTPGPALRPWLVVLCVTGATVLPTYLNGALTVALPTIGAQIGLSASQLQWPLTVNALVNGAFLLVSGGLADALGRRYMFLAGTVWIMVFSIPLAVIEQGTPFIAMSAVMGFGAALCSPAATGILSENLPDGKFKNAAFACLGAGQPLGFIVGLVVGGLFADNKYRIYLIAIVGAGLFAFIALCTLPEDGVRLLVKGRDNSEENRQSTAQPRTSKSLLLFDWVGAALITLGIILLTLGLTFAGSQQRGWKSLAVLLCLPISIVILVAFFLWESYQERQTSSYEEGQVSQALTAPLIPPGLWKAPGFAATLACIFFAWLSFNSLSFYCTLVFQEIQKTSPIQTSIRFLPMIGSGLVLNIAGGILVSRINAFWLFLAGSVGCAASCVLFSLVSPTQSYAKGFLWVMILNVFPDIFFSAAQLFACQTVGPQRAALAGSLFNVTIRLATSIGLALTSSIATTVTAHSSSSKTPSDALLEGYRAAGWICFATSAIAALLSVVFLRNVGVVGLSQIQNAPAAPIAGSDETFPEIELHDRTAPQVPVAQLSRRGKQENGEDHKVKTKT